MRKCFLTYQRICVASAFVVQGLCLLLPNNANARSVTDTFGLYIAPNAAVYMNNNAQAGVFSNVINSGILGSVQNSMLNMMGDIWRNTGTASYPDEWGINNNSSFTGVGGAFRFASTTSQQYLSGAYAPSTNPKLSFPNLIVANTRGLFLYQDDAQIRGTLLFENGLFWLNGNNLFIGSTNPGAIDGYSDTKFVATGNAAKGGFLYRAKVIGASGNVIFPVGPQTGSYAPISIMFNTAVAQDLHVRVFDNVYTGAFIGTTGNPASVQQTWNIGQEDTASVPSIIAIQHMFTREGPSFAAHRGNSYISMYNFNLQTWDTLGPSGVTSPGTITTGTKLAGTYINARVLNSSLGLSTYLTKHADVRTDSVTLAKAAIAPTRQPDGTYLVTFLFLVDNRGIIPANSLQVLDTLDNVFKSPATFSVSSVTATGNLIANNAFDGTTDMGLLQPGSTLAAHKTDTITLIMNVNSNRTDAFYYNSASLTGSLTTYNGQYLINNRSVNGLTPPLPGAAPVPTPFTLSPSKYQLPQGFSPNGDGVNDRLIIGGLGNDIASITVFNKYGIMVYKNLNYHNDWDGTSNLGGPLSNQRVEDGTYFYKITITDAITGKQENFYGFISIWK